MALTAINAMNLKQSVDMKPIQTLTTKSHLYLKPFQIEESNETYKSWSTFLFYDILYNFVHTANITMPHVDKEWIYVDESTTDELYDAVNDYILQMKKSAYQNLKVDRTTERREYNKRVLASNYGETKAELLDSYNYRATDEKSFINDVGIIARKHLKICNLITSDQHALQIMNQLQRRTELIRTYLRDHEYFLPSELINFDVKTTEQRMRELYDAFYSERSLKTFIELRLVKIMELIYGYAKKYVKFLTHDTTYQIAHLFRSKETRQRERQELLTQSNKCKKECIEELKWLVNIIAHVPRTKAIVNDWLCQRMMYGFSQSFQLS